MYQTYSRHMGFNGGKNQVCSCIYGGYHLQEENIVNEMTLQKTYNYNYSGSTSYCENVWWDIQGILFWSDIWREIWKMYKYWLREETRHVHSREQAQPGRGNRLKWGQWGGCTESKGFGMTDNAGEAGLGQTVYDLMGLMNLFFIPKQEKLMKGLFKGKWHHSIFMSSFLPSSLSFFLLFPSSLPPSPLPSSLPSFLPSFFPPSFFPIYLFTSQGYMCVLWITIINRILTEL